MTFLDPPAMAAWQHRDARRGFEVVFFEVIESGYSISGCTTAIEEGEASAVDYSIALSADWTTRRAEVGNLVSSGRHTVVIEGDGEGNWLVDGEARDELAGCLDVDLECSSMTNAFPVRRMGLAIGQTTPAPAAYVRDLDLSVERLEQSYRLEADAGEIRRYWYESPAFGYTAELAYDEFGLVLDYPGLASRAA